MPMESPEVEGRWRRQQCRQPAEAVGDVDDEADDGEGGPACRRSRRRHGQ